MYAVSQYGFGTWECSLIFEGGPALASQDRDASVFIFNMRFFTTSQRVLFFNNQSRWAMYV